MKSMMSTPNGSLFYVAPEVLDKAYTSKCDIWSMGVVLYILLSGQVPFPGEDASKIINAVKKGEFTFQHDGFAQVSDLAKDLICKCLAKDPSQRCTAEEALAHPWFSSDAQLSTAQPYPGYKASLETVISSSMLQPVQMMYIGEQVEGLTFGQVKEVFLALDEEKNGTMKIEKFAHSMK